MDFLHLCCINVECRSSNPPHQSRAFYTNRILRKLFREIIGYRLITRPANEYQKTSKVEELICTSNCRGCVEVLLDVGGQDASQSFEDVGHSNEACETLFSLLIGSLKRQVRQPFPSSVAAPVNHICLNLQECDPGSKAGGKTTLVTTPKSDAACLGSGVYAVIMVGGALALFAYWSF